MKVFPIQDPILDEQIVAVHPVMKPNVSLDWRRRLNLYPGRTLSAVAMTTEQEGRAGRLTLHGQSLSPGVVTGLQVGLEQASTGAEPGTIQHFLHLTPGLGLAASGEDVSLDLAKRVDVANLPVYAPSAWLDGGPSAETGTGGELLLPRRLSRRLFGQLIPDLTSNPDLDLPRAGILVLQPAEMELSNRFDPEDPCEIDLTEDAFAEWQLIDAARLILYLWPTDWRQLPVPGDRWRNRIAYTIYQAERSYQAGQCLPWEELGVPVGLLGFDTEWAPAFVDRHSVVRAGGKPRRRSGLSFNAGNPFLWQARMEQLAEEMAAAMQVQSPIETIAGLFRYLPPAGLLPRNAISPRPVEGSTGMDHFFPSNYTVEAAPVPLDQLEVAIEASASLEPFDINVSDRVKVLVPVPDAFYEPDLLEVMEVDEEFQQTIDRFVSHRDKWLSRRQFVRQITILLDDAITGEPREYPEDADAAADEPTPDEALTIDPIDPDDPELDEEEKEYGTSVEDGERVVEAIEALQVSLEQGSPLRRTARLLVTNDVTLEVPADPVPPEGLQGKINYTEFGETTQLSYPGFAGFLSFSGPMSEEERDYLSEVLLVDNTADVEILYKLSQQDETVKLDELGLEGFIDFLEARIKAADDLVDFGFARTQTDMYRLRRLMLGEVGASRLATSPALAQISKEESALTLRKDLSDYLESVQVRNNASLSQAEAFNASGGGGDEPPESGSGSSARSFSTSAALSSEASLSGSSLGTSSTTSTSLTFSGRTGTVSSGTGSLSGSLATRTPGTSVSVSPGTIIGAPTSPVTGVIDTGLVSPLPGVPVVSGPDTVLLGNQLALATAIQPVMVAPTFAEASIDQITEKSPIVGKAANFRTVTVADRMVDPPAAEAKNYSVATKYHILSELAALDISLAGIRVPGFYSYDAEGNLVDAEGNPANRPNEAFRDFGFLQTNPTLISEVLQDRHDLDPADGDESAFFSAGVRALDHTIATLRLVEGRIQSYKQVVSRCQQVLAKTRSFLKQADSRLVSIGNELAEARHDVSVARALLAEETERVASINARRDLVVEQHVQFLAYHRPRVSDLLLKTPVYTLDPSPELLPDPVTACLQRNGRMPDELREMVELLRDLPVKWFTRGRDFLAMLDRPQTLLRAVTVAKAQAQIQPPVRSFSATNTTLGKAIHNTFLAQKQVSQLYRLQTAQLNLSKFSTLSWKRAQDQAAESLSLGDLIDGKHGRKRAAAAAQAELTDIADVATCIYTLFGQITPSIRLDWAERLSQFDQPVNLRNLSNLPRWREIDQTDSVQVANRRDLQRLVDWLYQRVVINQPEAVAMINDLVRVCILLASHAPVNEIIAGHVEEETVVKKGSQVKINVDPRRVRVGMPVLIYRQAKVVAQAKVLDLTSKRASVEVMKVVAQVADLDQGEAAVQPKKAIIAESITLRAGDKAQFAESNALAASAFVGAYKFGR